MLLQHPCDENDTDEEMVAEMPYVTVDDSTILVSEVTGAEAWFDAMKASQKVGEIVVLSNVIKMSVPEGKSAYFASDNGLVNMISVNMNSASTLLELFEGAENAQGKVTINDEVVVDKTKDTNDIINSSVISKSPILMLVQQPF